MDENNEIKIEEVNYIKIAIIVVLCFLIIAIIITYFAIVFTNNKENNDSNNIDNNTSDSITIKVVPDGYGITALSDKYYTNPIKINSIKYHKGTEIRESEWYSYYPISADYFEISGLKNTEIQNRINNEIKDTVFNLLNTAVENYPSYDTVNIYSYCVANYSNILSIKLFSEVRTKKKSSINELGFEYEYQYQYIYLNYNLITGEKLQFTDLFTNTANIKNILSQSAYNSLAWNYHNWNNWTDDEIKNYSELGNDVFKFLYYYSSNKEIDFYFTAKNIFLNIEGIDISIDMIDFYNDIAIFNRFKNTLNAIYTNEYKNYSSYVCTEFWPENYYYFQIDEENSNLFIDIEALNTSNSLEKKLVDEKLEQINAELLTIKSYLNDNKDKAFLYSVMILTNSYEGKTTINVDYTKFSMSLSYYNDSFFNTILNTLQSYGLGGGIGNYYYIDDTDKEKYDVEEIRSYEYKTYNTETGEEIIEE